MLLAPCIQTKVFSRLVLCSASIRGLPYTGPTCSSSLYCILMVVTIDMPSKACETLDDVMYLKHTSDDVRSNPVETLTRPSMLTAPVGDRTKIGCEFL